uniref:Uncharacterized protein n=1 Tax=Alexandrium monilatum TaxID=311494 RepID=A0A7S4RUQ7_9DINO
MNVSRRAGLNRRRHAAKSSGCAVAVLWRILKTRTRPRRCRVCGARAPGVAVQTWEFVCMPGPSMVAPGRRLLGNSTWRHPWGNRDEEQSGGKSEVMLYILRRMEMGVAPSGRTLLVAKKAPLLPEGGASESGGAARPRACREGRLCAGPADWYAGSPG